MSKLSSYLNVGFFALSLVGVGLFSATNVIGYKSEENQSVLKGELSADFEDHYDESLPIKSMGTSVWAAIQYVLFKEGRKGVAVGKSGWLFTEEELYASSSAEQNLDANLNTITRVQEILDQHGVELVVTLLPAKVEIYEQYLGGAKPSTYMQNYYATILEKLDQRVEHLIDVKPLFMQAREKEEVFFHSDTHWTPQGAELVSELVAASVEDLSLDLEPKVFRSEVVKEEPHYGDLMSYIPVSPYFSFLLQTRDQLVVKKTSAETEESLDLFSEEEANVVLVGTSYSANANWNFEGALKSAMKTDIINFSQEGKGPIVPMLEYLESDDFLDNPPALVIWEVPVRYLPVAYAGDVPAVNKISSTNNANAAIQN